MNNSDYIVCNNCIMDTTSPDIKFNADGICNYCIKYKKNIGDNIDYNIKNIELKKIINKIKYNTLKNNNKYDCMIGVSGGLDSSYLVYYVVRILKIKPLLFHVDAGWNSSISANNIEKLIDGLDLDLVTKVINWNEMRDLHLAYFKSGVPSLDTIQDHAYFGAIYKYAEENNIKYIFTGANYATEFIRAPLDWAYHASDTRQIKDIHKRFGTIKITSFPLYDIFRSKFYLKIIKGLKVYYPLNFIKYDKKQSIDILKNNFNWQEYPNKHHESKFTAFFENYWSFRRFGHDRRKLIFSGMILSGQMSRKEAIKKLKTEPINEIELKKEINYICDKLNISKSELSTYFKLDKKSFRDYKSNYVLIKFFTKILNILNIEKRIF